MTDRLYYDQTYLREFDATVTGCVQREDGLCEVTLDRSAFYPTSGGQPFDTGIITHGDHEYPVTNVIVSKDGEVLHLIPAGLVTGDHVHGKIDWDRRFEHMQQHGGEHMLAGLIWEKLGGMTIGLHLGKEMSTIDVSFPDEKVRVTDDEIKMLEENVNRRIQQDDPVRCWFPSEEELKTLPLRKAPTVSEHVRIVAFGDYEMVACGGTHPARTGEIGCLRILSVTPARGKARFAFVCGMRAIRLNRLTAGIIDKTGTLLSAPPEGIVSAVTNLKDKITELSDELKELRAEQIIGMLKEKREDLGNGVSLITLWTENGNADALMNAVQKMIRDRRTVVLAGTAGRLVFARSQDLDEDMALLIRETGKGGGRPEFASGSGSEESILKAAVKVRMSFNAIKQ